ncbi:constitutive coactivator of peroxisome proliferator-activated receptor gamma [Rhineura floridana]|uniref:constitutive coactivator of peroxisome proliferator-activated receptor gamma n=1 Tax=Rhineura floridana TaxID=261503 RepID=UPI002AC861B0|nr:constitutive coactivator of peroxisome proliferator-activated receptor gamma [Rhineura floridana]XP_061480423.1 constitutive coactivator of peroxisome proliferator-activated receptor gamma [Rhineura floridana]XP_061480424.1 constitutive coactivator of peroxisome proliferator-activated receptor gamma [Rhineura floridana]XP_061480425.1 constitutive coactivator of peroxisome proliferator-activated receptor gamma [Rhineura floridana]
MGVKGLYSFVTNACPGGCTVVNLKEVAEDHRSRYPASAPVLVVDAMSCLRQWYTAESWVCGGQWCEYLSNLDGFINAFTAAGIKLVFYFDGLVEEKKRDEWVKRRLKNNKEIARIFQFIKTNKQQPGRGMFFIPSGLATFTRFGLKALGQETICSLQEADYEVASYALHNNCMGILGEDTDYLIYDTAPYFSINKLSLDRLDTVMFSRQNLCRKLGLHLTELPLFACILGTDTIPEKAMERFRNQCVASYCAKSQGSDKRANVILAVASYISTIPRSYDSLIALAEMLPLGSDKSLLCKGIQSYLLPGQQSPWLPCGFSYHSAASFKQDMPLCLDQEIFQIAKEQLVRAESRMVYNVLCHGELDCSNTLEDEHDTELPGQALIYRLARQHIYSVLLESVKDTSGPCPVIKEWFVYAGNSLQQPDLVQPKQLPGGTPSLRSLWFSRGLEAEKQRRWTFLACFQLQDIAEELQPLETPVGVVCSLLLYLMLQVDTLSLEDLNAFIAQTLCLEGKSAVQLADLQLAQVDSRGVQLGSLFIRGLSVMISANSACGFPFRMDDLMPWRVFDGKLFQEKYQQVHRGCPLHELLEGNESWLAKFQNLMSLICKACSANGRIIQSRQRLNSFMTERQERGRGSCFQNANRIQSRPYRHHNRDCLWRGPQSTDHSFESQPLGREYRPRHQPLRGQRFQLASRWPR